MSAKLTRRRLLGAGVLGLSTGLAGCTGATPSGTRDASDREIDFDDGSLSVETDSGGATVHRTDADTVQLHVEKEAASVLADVEDATVETTRDGDHLRIVADSPSTFLGLRDVQVDLEVGVPDGVTVESVEGRNGDATATGVTGDVALETTNGNAEAREVDGFVSLSSTNGRVLARDVAGLDGAETTNGDVEVEIPAVRDDVRVEATNGLVTAALSPDLDATVVVETTNGETSVQDLPIQADGSVGDELRGTLGDGTHDLRFETTNGNVELARLD